MSDYPRTIFYRVILRTRVDRPDLRGSTFAPVKPGHVVVSQRDVWTLAEATSRYSEAIDGAWDFESEYLESAEVVRMSPGSSPRTVRRRVERNRAATGRVYTIAA